LDRHFDSCEEDRGVAKWFRGAKKKRRGGCKGPAKIFRVKAKYSFNWNSSGDWGFESVGHTFEVIEVLAKI